MKQENKTAQDFWHEQEGEGGVAMPIDVPEIMKLLRVSMSTAKRKMNALLRHCGKGNDYVPNDLDFANFMKWNLGLVQYYRHSTRHQLLENAVENVKELCEMKMKIEWLNEVKINVMHNIKGIVDDIIIVAPSLVNQNVILNRISVNKDGRLTGLAVEEATVQPAKDEDKDQYPETK